MSLVGYFDLVGGAAGDMLMAALVDAGASLDKIRARVRDFGLDVKIETRIEHPQSLYARKIDVITSHHTHHRPYRQIKARIEAVDLPPRVREISLAAFHALAKAESKAHGVAVDDVEFHEVGSDDAIADVLGVATAIDELGVSRLCCSPVPMGRGIVVGAHGPIPIPGPATLALLKGAPLLQTDLNGETVTPTGAALLTVLCAEFGSMPSMRLLNTGTGGGTRAWPDRPNIVRFLIGEEAPAFHRTSEEVLLEANLDDLAPEYVAALTGALADGGAVDVWTQAVTMKKGRSAVVVSAIARAERVDAMAAIFFRHSTTLGLRSSPISRLRVPREMTTVETPYGPVRIKVATVANERRIKPEFADCEALANEAGVSAKSVFDAAFSAAWAQESGAASEDEPST